MSANTKVGEILTLLDALVEEKTFNLDSLTRVQALRENVDALRTQLELAQSECQNLRTECSKLRAECEAMRSREDDVAKRENVVRGAELEIALVRKELELTRTFKGELKEVVMAAFKNPVIRQSAYGNVPVVQNGYVSSHPTNSETVISEDDRQP